MFTRMFIGLPLVVCVGVGCAGHAEYVTLRPDGGVLRLVSVRDKADADARDRMAKHCGPQGYTVVEQGEAVIGSDTSGGAVTDYRGTTTTSSLTGDSTTRGSATTPLPRRTRRALSAARRRKPARRIRRASYTRGATRRHARSRRRPSAST